MPRELFKTTDVTAVPEEAIEGASSLTFTQTRSGFNSKACHFRVVGPLWANNNPSKRTFPHVGVTATATLATTATGNVAAVTALWHRNHW